MNEKIAKEQFSQYLNNKVIETTIEQYLYKLDGLGEWFYENKITKTKLNIWLDTKEITQINSKLKGEFKELWQTTNKQKKNWLSSPWNHWVMFNKIQPTEEILTESIKFNYTTFTEISKTKGLIFSNSLILRYTAALLTKPFVLLTGLSGSGKTKLAQTIAMWICQNKEQYKIVAVGADWTNREPLLGYPNGLDKDSYVKPDSGVLDLILAAKNNTDKPYFLILDEMNLSHVERYFADFLSCMESGEEILLHSGYEDWNGVPAKISLPSNLFIIGTVNIDETTYMFSPKVLDRANVIEFRVTASEMDEYLKNSKPLNLEDLTGQGSNMAGSFLDIAGNKELVSDKAEEMAGVLINFFTELKKAGAEFGYRSASEIKRFAAVVTEIEPEWTVEEIIDAAIMQKLLPKLHGSRRKLEPVLKTLGTFCIAKEKKIEDYIAGKEGPEIEKALYPVSLEKILRMYKGLIDNGFTSYAEA
jgi:5-methylcytosine-specific restriction protein B